MIDTKTLQHNIYLKTQLLIYGCDIDHKVQFPQNIYTKQMHLYSHSAFSTTKQIPDDILLGENACIVRIRYNPQSFLKIIEHNGAITLHNTFDNSHTSISFVSQDLAAHEPVNEKMSVSDVCGFLGNDLLGVIPSNYCFYFKDNNECRFCEIAPTYEKFVDYDKPVKKSEIIKKAIQTVITNKTRFKHLAITSGNVKSYDHTAEMFCKIGSDIYQIPESNKLQDVLATLMPPDNFNLIDKIKAAGFNKIYFPLEIYDRELFAVICPGKFKYGYEKMLAALEYSLDVFGVGNVYTNFVYGIQAIELESSKKYDPAKENEKALIAAEQMLAKKIIPAFTLYHYGGFNHIGNIDLSLEHTLDFFRQLGEQVFKSNLIRKQKDTFIFDSLSLSNTLYNENFMLAKYNNGGI